MSLLRDLHQRWATHRPLAELVPPERVVTGLALSGLPLPYVTWSRLPDETAVRTSSGRRFSAARVRCSIHDSDLDAAGRVADALERLLSGADYDYSGGRVLDARRAAREAQPATDGVWRVSVDFLLTLDEPQEP